MATGARKTATVRIRTQDGEVQVETDGQTATLRVRDLVSGAHAATALNALEASMLSDILNSVTAVEEDDDD
jgi:hypothetical protein